MGYTSGKSASEKLHQLFIIPGEHYEALVLGGKWRIFDGYFDLTNIEYLEFRGSGKTNDAALTNTLRFLFNNVEYNTLGFGGDTYTTGNKLQDVSGYTGKTRCTLTMEHNGATGKIIYWKDCYWIALINDPDIQ